VRDTEDEFSNSEDGVPQRIKPFEIEQEGAESALQGHIDRSHVNQHLIQEWFQEQIQDQVVAGALAQWMSDHRHHSFVRPEGVQQSHLDKKWLE